MMRIFWASLGAWAAHVLHWVIAICVGLIVAPALIGIGAGWFFSVFPVNYDWQPVSVAVDGRDVVVSGTLRKRWDCEYQPPPRATDESGVHLRVISHSATPTLTLSADPDLAYKFGPWRIEDGAGRSIRVWQHHQCWGVFDAFSQLGTLDMRAGK